MNKTEEIQFAYIAPTNYLKFVPQKANFHLILAHLLEDKEYVEFYQEKLVQGHIVICDNGAFEFGKPLEADEILKLLKKARIAPTVLVAPDYPNEKSDKTIKSAYEFYDKLRNTHYNIMVVPQSEEGNVDGWMKAYMQFAVYDNIFDMIGMSILGIPNAFKSLTHSEAIAYNRIIASISINNALRDFGFTKKIWHHYLGMGEGPQEIPFLRAANLIDSIDSSSPIWHGIHGKKYEKNHMWGLSEGKLKTPVDFSFPAIPDEHENVEVIEYNINFIEHLVS